MNCRIIWGYAISSGLVVCRIQGFQCGVNVNESEYSRCFILWEAGWVFPGA